MRRHTSVAPCGQEPTAGDRKASKLVGRQRTQSQASARTRWCLRYERSEQMKERRRQVGDHGGIKFQGKVACPRDDGCVNTLTAVLKDNLIVEGDYAAEPRTTQT